MKKVFSIVLLLSTISIFSQGKITIPQAINIISKQSMLSQRMAKDRMYKDHSENAKDVSQRKLISSVVQFENNLSSIQSMSLPDEIQAEITHIKLLWFGYKQSVLGDENEQTSTEIMQYNDVVLSVCENVFSNLLKMAKKKKSYPYNTNSPKFSEAYISVNNLKHTTQRLSLYYTAYFYKIAKYDGDTFEGIISDIDYEVQAVSNIKNLNVEYLKRTTQIQNEWESLKKLLIDVRDKKFISVRTSPKPELIYEGSNKLLKLSDLLGRTYKAVNEINN